ncbi:uncharacterized protein LOC143080774 [Mytilus galloprovincialis]|uniref:uncharacterized protein LOC143080774 n=1 Tax=Mytilus galloprovincialis TaxID=29158 RepID=UPI003F7BD155
MLTKTLTGNCISIFKRRNHEQIEFCHRFLISLGKPQSSSPARLRHISSFSSQCFCRPKKKYTCNTVKSSSLSVTGGQQYSQIYPCSTIYQSFSTSAADYQKDKPNDKETAESEITDKTESSDSVEQNLSIFQRFKKAYKEHGKVLIGVHLVTSTFWFGSFYYLALSGIDVVPLLERMGAGETIMKPFKSSHAGEIAVAYLLYKLATPARYTVTLAGTNFTIKYLQKSGKMVKPAERESFKEIYKDGKQELKEKRKEIDTKIKTRTQKYSKK